MIVKQIKIRCQWLLILAVFAMLGNWQWNNIFRVTNSMRQSPVPPINNSDFRNETQNGIVRTPSPKLTNTRRSLQKVVLTSLIASEFGTELIPHFVKYYHQLGISFENMIFIVHGFSVAKIEETTSILKGLGVNPRHEWLGQYSSKEAHARELQLLEEFVTYDDWVILADMDEFHEYLNYSNVQIFLNLAEKNGKNAIKGYFVDRLAASRKLEKVDPILPIFEQFPLQCTTTKDLARGHPFKVLAFKGCLRPSIGGHGIEHANHPKCRERFWRESLKVHHFKWVDGVKGKLEIRAKLYKSRNIYYWKESQNVIDYLNDHNNTLPCRLQK